jgi:toxin ParE1/3/4
LKRYFIQPNASARPEDIYRFSFQRFGQAQADRYLDGAFALFEDIAARRIIWRRIPGEFGVDGFFTRYQSHFVFWKQRPDGQIAIAAILHRRMDLARRLQEDASEP